MESTNHDRALLLPVVSARRVAEDLVEGVHELRREFQRPPLQELDVLQHRRVAQVTPNHFLQLKSSTNDRGQVISWVISSVHVLF